MRVPREDVVPGTLTFYTRSLKRLCKVREFAPSVPTGHLPRSRGRSRVFCHHANSPPENRGSTPKGGGGRSCTAITKNQYYVASSRSFSLLDSFGIEKTLLRSSETIKSFQPGLHLVYSQTKGRILLANSSEAAKGAKKARSTLSVARAQVPNTPWSAHTLSLSTSHKAAARIKVLTQPI